MGYGVRRRLALGVKRLIGALPVPDSILTSGAAFFRLRRRRYRIDGDEVAPVPTFTPDQLAHGTIRTGNGTQTVRCLPLGVEGTGR